MQGDYFAFIATAYGVSFVALSGLGLWVFMDARRTLRELEAQEAANGRRRAAPR